MKRRKLKAAAQNTANASLMIHDRQATQLPAGALIAVTEVDDPYDRANRISVVRNVRDDPLAALHARKQIDDAKYVAGRTWQRYYETAMIGGLQGQDTTREPVDGGGISVEFLTEQRRRAVDKLIECGRVLGRDGDGLVRDVLGRGMHVTEAAAARGCFSLKAKAYVGQRFRECLECLAREFGYA